MRRALFLFPTDTMGGAENVTRMTAKAALESGEFDQIVLFLLCKPTTGSLDSLVEDKRVLLLHSGSPKERYGIVPLLKALHRNAFDFVFSSHTHLNAAASLARHLGVLRTKRLVARESTMFFERQFGLRGRIAKRFYNLYGAQDLIVCQSRRMASSLAQHTANRFASKTRVIPNPVTLHPCRTTSAPKSHRLVWCGRLVEVKNPLLALDTLTELRARNAADWSLSMIGDGPLAGAVSARIAELGLEGNVTLHGRLDDPLPAMAEGRIGLVTSRVEGFPNVILEMMSVGLHGIASTDCAGDLDLVPNLSLATSQTSHALADAIEAVQSSAPLDDDERHSFVLARQPERFLERLIA